MRALRTSQPYAAATRHHRPQLGERLGWDWSLFGKMEKGETLGSPEVIQALDTHYGTPGLLLALWELAVGDHTQFRERYRRYMALETKAVSSWHFAVSVLPGLLQTPGYAREVLAAGGLKGKELEQQVEARMRLRELLEGENAPPFRTILSEAVLRTPLRDVEWRGQLEYVVEVAERGSQRAAGLLSWRQSPERLTRTATAQAVICTARAVAVPVLATSWPDAKRAGRRR